MSNIFNAAEKERLNAIRANPGVGAAQITATAKPHDPQATSDALKAPRPT